MDNREISIISEGKSDFDLAIRLAMSGRTKITSYICR